LEYISPNFSKQKRSKHLFALDTVELVTKPLGPQFAKVFQEIRNTISLIAPLETRIRECVMAALREKGIDYIKYLMTVEKSTRVIVTNSGMLGLAPSVSKPGDVVAIVKGARAPFILRSNERGGCQYKIVGQAYIRGMMFGEVLEITDFKEIEII
jgi:hypothetical protein